MKIFEQLYELHGQIEREAERYELVIGDGIVSWRLPDGGIFHPVLIRRVQLEFDVRIPRFRVVDLDKPTELYTALFSTIAGVDGQWLAQCQSELQEGDCHPLTQDAEAFLKRFAITLSSQGTLIENGQPRLMPNIRSLVAHRSCFCDRGRKALLELSNNYCLTLRRGQILQAVY
jgi:hypothetical protein